MGKLGNDYIEVDLGKVYLDTLSGIAEKNENVVDLESDLLLALGPDFKNKYPDRTFDCGIQEADMVGVAAGMSAGGLVPYVHTFACFITRKAYDQIYISGAYAHLNIKLFGSDPGIKAEYNGGTHMPFDDMGIMRGLPNAIVMDVADPYMMKSVMEQMESIYGIQYVRFPRRGHRIRKLYSESTVFEIGKGIINREGKDITIIASGLMTSEAVDAADILAQKGIEARVVDMFTCKPIDKELIIDSARKTGYIFTVENHSILNGLGSAVAEVLSENYPTRLKRIGIDEQFGEVGDFDYLIKRFSLSAEQIAETILNALKK